MMIIEIIIWWFTECVGSTYPELSKATRPTEFNKRLSRKIRRRWSGDLAKALMWFQRPRPWFKRREIYRWNYITVYIYILFFWFTRHAGAIVMPLKSVWDRCSNFGRVALYSWFAAGVMMQRLFFSQWTNAMLAAGAFVFDWLMAPPHLI